MQKNVLLVLWWYVCSIQIFFSGLYDAKLLYHTTLCNAVWIHLTLSSATYCSYLLLGNLSIWDDLNWVFRLHHADKIQLLVYSGSSSNHTCVGKRSCVVVFESIECHFVVQNEHLIWIAPVTLNHYLTALFVQYKCLFLTMYCLLYFSFHFIPQVPMKSLPRIS